jgi:DHA2 family multidrug resistance protein
MMLRIYQSIGLPFLFVPINTVVYAGVPPSKSNQVSGIINLARNMGGDIGIATVTTLIARRAQFHQARLSSGADPTGHVLMARLAGIAQALQHAGASATTATKQAYGAVYRQLVQQAQTLAYLDALFVLACFAAIMIPFVLLTRGGTGGAPMAH